MYLCAEVFFYRGVLNFKQVLLPDFDRERVVSILYDLSHKVLQ